MKIRHLLTIIQIKIIILVKEEGRNLKISHSMAIKNRRLKQIQRSLLLHVMISIRKAELHIISTSKSKTSLTLIFKWMPLRKTYTKKNFRAKDTSISVKTHTKSHSLCIQQRQNLHSSKEVLILGLTSRKRFFHLI